MRCAWHLFLSAPAVVVATLWVAGWHRPVAAVAFGPGGRPVVLAAGRGRLVLLVSNLPLGQLVAWSVDVRRMAPTRFGSARDDLATGADHQVGDTLVPAPLGAMSTTTAVSHNRYDLSAGWGSRPFTVVGTWYAYASAPAWAVAPVLTVLPAAAVRRAWRRRRRTRAGACPASGYDLRASPGRCPECGRPAVTSR